ncbi:Homoserine kinase [Clostridium liquoris]|jgi:homoserine kinase|uniref:Homoserine kinase n=1 Tax=Clostridium liquoris TaxID=1289519 RepID=A0A2T0B174_9CLOT|nr:homoserine kinase [Clostridium liquoris]PRR77380.1 Homoserine kinase [Clostridium liquoris]
MIEVVVPATSANFGPGFDTLGVSLNLYNRFYIEEIEKGLVIEGCAEEYKNEDNLVYTSMKRCFKKLGYKEEGIRIIIESDIPSSRGLGSSAACIVGGILGANSIAGNKLNKDEMLKLATEIEGHPDNVAPAILGGMTAAIYEDNNVYYDKIKIKEGIKFCALIPNFKLSTEKSREVLPKEVAYKDAVFNVGRVSLMITSLINGNYDLLKIACKDKLHEPYRSRLIEDYDKIIDLCNDSGALGVFLSGAGPTIMILLEEKNTQFYKNIKGLLKNLKKVWKFKELHMDLKGAIAKEY